MLRRHRPIVLGAPTAMDPSASPDDHASPTGSNGNAPILRFGDRVIDTSRPLVMAVVNATPDSFSDRQRLTTTAARAARCFALLDEGADILDVGGQSGITGVPEISEDEEASRVVPLVEAVVAERPETVVSVDTYRPAVSRAVIDAGAAIINDVSGLAHPELVALCADAGSGLVVMHTRVAPKHKLLDPDLYDDVTDDVVAMLREKVAAATVGGLDADALIVDPGIDYAKTPYQSVEVLRHADAITALGRPVLWALSRKDFIGAITGRRPSDRLPGTLAAIGHVGARPGAIFRVHDVAATIAYLRVQQALQDGDVLARDAALAIDNRRER